MTTLSEQKGSSMSDEHRNDQQTETTHRDSSLNPSGLVFGMLLGVGFGIAIGNTISGIAIGAAFGIALGMAFDERAKK
jgi:hypothetical protein